MSIPDFSPLVAANLVCHECGTVLKPKVVMGRKGQKQVVDSSGVRLQEPEDRMQLQD